MTKNTVKNKFLIFTLISTLLMLANTHYTSSVQGPRTDDLIINFYSDITAAYTALKAGEIEILAYTGWSAALPLHDGEQFHSELFLDAVADPNIVLAPLAGNDIVGFDFNNNWTIPTYPGVRSPMSYQLFRQALAHLVDKNFVVTQIKQGFASEIDVPIPATQSDWWNPNVTGLAYPYGYNPVTAEGLFDSAGFVQGTTPNPYYDPAFPGSAQYIRTYPPGHSQAGMDLAPMIFQIRLDDLAMLQAGRYLADNMRKHGIPVTLVEVPKSVLYEPVMGTHDYHIYTGGWITKKWPIYLHKLYHSDFYLPYESNYVTGVNSTGSANYPLLDKQLEQIWYNQTYLGSKSACYRAQQIMVDECISVWLYSSQSYVAYRDLLGIVNMDGYGPINKYTFMNAYKPDGSPIRVGLVNPPLTLNAMYSDWIYDWICLDRIYCHLMNEAPYDMTADQPWVAQDWYIDTWYDSQDGLNKTRVTYWLRENGSWIEPVTGNWDGNLTSHDVEFSIWFNYAHNDSWHWNDVMDIHHTKIVDDLCIEVYFNVSSYWPVYWVGEQLPILPKHLWIEAFCEMKETSLILSKDYIPCEKFRLPVGNIVQTVNVWLDGVPLTEGIDYNIIAEDGCHNWFHWLIPANTSQNLIIQYWTPYIDPHGYTPGDYPWNLILEGCGLYYATAFTPGVGGFLVLRRNSFFSLETPILGDIDFLWCWAGYDETRRIDSNRAPRHGCYQITASDDALVVAAYGSQGTSVPSINWFPGADIAIPVGDIDAYDRVTLIGHYGARWGCTGPLSSHDVAIINVTTSKTGCLPKETVGQGKNASIFITVENQGSTSETFDVHAKINTTILGSQTASLNAGQNITLTFVWDTTSYTYGNYSVSAAVDTVICEIDIADNTMMDGTVLITITGDVDGDRDVDIFDIVRVTTRYQMIYPHPNWDPNTDIIENRKIDIFDVVAAAGNYLESW